MGGGARARQSFRSFLAVSGIFTAMSVLCGQPTPGGGTCRRPVAVAGGPCGAEHSAIAAVRPVPCGPAAVPPDPMPGGVDPADPGWAEAGIDEDEAEGWAAAGFDPGTAAGWRDAGFEYAADDARAWADAGIEPARAWGWSMADIGPADVGEWEELGCTPGEAGAWQHHGIESAYTASTWIDHGISDPEEVSSWRSASDHFTDPEVAAAWRELGLDPGEASEWDWAGWSAAVTVRDLGDWVQVRTRCRNRFDPDDLYRFDEEGLSPDDVALLHDGPGDAVSDRWERLVFHQSAEVRAAAARADNLSYADFDRFVSDDGDEIRQAAAEHPACPPQILGRLAGDSDPWVRAAVAGHPSSSPEVLERLASDPAEEVRAAVAKNASAPGAARAHAGLLSD